MNNPFSLMWGEREEVKPKVPIHQLAEVLGKLGYLMKDLDPRERPSETIIQLDNIYEALHKVMVQTKAWGEQMAKEAKEDLVGFVGLEASDDQG